MEQRNWRASCFLLLMPILLFFSVPVDAYKNYTVADSLGWYDNLEKPTVNYQKWADAKTFSLGDFIVFNTDTNHSVVQTYNSTIYKFCDYDDAKEKDTIQWSSADPSNTTPLPVTVAVPLVKEGMNYFFSSDYDGEQCMNGQKFSTNVTHGKGLPPSMKEPSDDMSPAPISPDSGADDLVPDTIIPSANFDHPKDMSDTGDEDDKEDTESDKKTSNCNSLLASLKLLHTTLSSVLILLGLLCMF